MKANNIVWSPVVALLLCIGCQSVEPRPQEPLLAPASLKPAGPIHCNRFGPPCSNVDAVVFVHGIYGDDETFVNGQFDWPREFAKGFPGRSIDVFRLNYRTALLSWSSAKNPKFEEVAEAVMDALQPLRKREYRSIGFIAHSLGGNVVSTYLHMVKSEFGHPQRSQHAFVITLATPVLGSQIADLADVLKDTIGINDDLLTSLKHGNLYLRMLKDFREREFTKENRYRCRAVNLHAAFETRYVGPILVVPEDSSVRSIRSLADSPVKGFPLNHIEMAKPRGPQGDPVYDWVMDRVRGEYNRLASWESAHARAPLERRLCEAMDFVPELED